MKSAIILLSLLMMVKSSKPSEGDWRIILANRDTIATLSLIELRGDSLGINNAGLTQWIHVDSITEIKRAGKSKFRLGAAIGFVCGGVIGGVIGHRTPGTLAPFASGPGELPTAAGIIIGGAVGFAVGGWIGSSAGRDEVYLLSQQNENTKRRTIRWLLSR